MLTYSFVKIGSDAMYIHLYKCLKKDILSGTLKAGEKLPSKRSFAKNLGVSVITVENAYAQLVAEGYLYSKAKKGYYVVQLEPSQKNLEKLPREEVLSVATVDKAYIADFASNQISVEQFPFSIWAKLIRALLTDNQQEILRNSPCGGTLDLRQSIADYLKEFRGMNIRAEQVVVGAGTEYLYGLLVQLLGRDKIYGVENPGYKKIAQVYESNAVGCEYVDFGKEGIDLKALEEKAVDVIHISPSHHFPTGQVMPIGARYELLAWASKKANRYIIEDDYDSEFRLVGQPIPTLQSIDAMEKVIYMNTFTKTIASTIRISYMVLPYHLVKRFYDKLSFYACTIPNLEQYTLARFIKEGYFEKHINRMRTYYHKKRDLLVDKLSESQLAKIVTIYEEDSGLHFLMKIDTKLSDEVFQKKMAENGIKICTLSEYYYDNQAVNNHIFVVNYSSLTENQIEKAIAVMEKVLLF